LVNDKSFFEHNGHPPLAPDKQRAIAEQIAALSRRLALLQQPDFQNNKRVLEVALQELQNTLEELMVAQEELCQQTEELTTAHYALEEQRLRYHDLFEFAPDAYLATDTYGVIREANRAATALFNVPKHYLIGIPVTVFVPLEELHAFRTQLDRLPNLPQVQGWEVLLHRQGGATFPSIISVAAVRGPQSEPPDLHWLIRNITEGKPTEETFRRTQEQFRQPLPPVLPIRKQLLLLPIIGLIDSECAAQLTERLLSTIRSQRARAVVIDVTGVPIIDTFVANHLLKAAEAARLLGVTVILTGLSSEVAQILVKTGVDLSPLKTLGDLPSGIEEAERLLDPSRLSR
jgi:anti-anti-sigma factor